MPWTKWMAGREDKAWNYMFAPDRCWRCGRKVNKEIPLDDMDNHHIVPKSDGGPDAAWNRAWIDIICHNEITKKMRRRRIEPICPYCEEPLGPPIKVYEFTNNVFIDGTCRNRQCYHYGELVGMDRG